MLLGFGNESKYSLSFYILEQRTKNKKIFLNGFFVYFVHLNYHWRFKRNVMLIIKESETLLSILYKSKKW